MKSYLLITVLLVGLQALTAQTNNIFVNFDDVDMAFSTFSSAQFQKVLNPSKTGINTSNYVGQVTSSSGSTYEGIYNSTLYAPMDFSVMKTFKMKVLSPRIGNVAFKLEYSLNKTVDYITVKTATTKVGEWEDIYFDFPAAKTNLYDRIVISFDMDDNTHNGEKWYFDDVTLTTKPAISSLTLPNVFSSNMVMQQNTLTSVWGWASAGESVEITAGWGTAVTVIADPKGKWSAKIQTPTAIAGQATPYTLTFKTTTKVITLTNVLIGDVWICSGQSNMEYTMTPNLPWTRGVFNYFSEIAAANFPSIRLFKVPRNPQAIVANNCGGTWLECNPTNVAAISGVAYYFARELFQHPSVNIPIGILVTAHGGSNCQTWISREALVADQELKTAIIDPYDASPTSGNPENRPTNLYNGMISPLVPFGIKGALWYQGEANASSYGIYPKLMNTLINDWRTRWGLGDFPFYYVQLPAYSSTNWAAMRDAQTTVLTTTKTGMAVSLDIVDSDPANIHPENKREIGERLAKWALAKDYGQSIVFSGPVYKSAVVQGNKMLISFHPTTIGTGLKSKDAAPLREFEICGSNGVFYPADAVISGNTVEVSSVNITQPAIVQYAFKANPLPNLTNNEGFPAAPFKTSTWNNAIVINGVVSGIKEISNSTAFKISADGKMLYSNLQLPARVQIFDITGKLLLSSKTEPGEAINISKLCSGVYVFESQSAKQVSTYKLVKRQVE